MGKQMSKVQFFIQMPSETGFFAYRKKKARPEETGNMPLSMLMVVVLPGDEIVDTDFKLVIFWMFS